MNEPLSPRNAEVARLRSLTRDRRARYEAGRFVVEGAKLVAECLASDLVVYDTYVAAGWQIPADLRQALDQHDVDITWVSERGLERIATTTSPQPIVAEVRLPVSQFSDLERGSSVLVAVDLNDPGNLGTIARSSVAAGFDAIVVLGDTVDPFSPKVVRASAGSLFRVPIVTERDARAGLESLGDLELTRFGTRMVDATPCDQADLTGALALLLGSEAHGLGADYDEYVDEWLAVPMPGDTESLNVAMAGTILAYETARQRRVANA